ncbi:MAG TPA: xanthine dehydrogenase family protein subunit M [Candidatus Limnocylindria bacterium]
MIPGEFDYERPSDLGAVLRILDERGDEAKLLAGGHSLLPVLKFRLAQPEVIVDLRSVTGLDTITETDGELRIGALVTHAQAMTDPATERYIMLREMAAGIGDRQVRNWGTIGGSCAHADPNSDWPALLIAARASLVCNSVGGERVVPARDFFTGVFETAIESNEMLTEVRIPARTANTGGAYQKLERRAGDFSTVGVAVRMHLDGGTIAQAGVALTAVPSPMAATDAEAILVGAAPSEETFAAAADAAAAQSEPVSDAHGPADYKRAMVREMTLRALRLAHERAASYA